MHFMISSEVMSIRKNKIFYLIRLMSPSFLVKMFELHIETFHSDKSIPVFFLAGRFLILT
jgi:hypothetical protein